MRVCPTCQSELLVSNGAAAGKAKKHCHQLHWFGRFKRTSILVAKSKGMVDLTMALFAKFWVNENQDELLSLLA
jgi:insertion element IS1 protein InsB